MDNKKSAKIRKNFYCKSCDYTTSDKKDYNKHLVTGKHTKIINGNIRVTKIPTVLTCHCGNVYKYRSGLSRHKKTCTHTSSTTDEVTENEPENDNASNPAENKEGNDTEQPEKEHIDINDLPDPTQIHDHVTNMMNGKLGTLAREIAEETAADLNINGDNADSVNDIFKGINISISSCSVICIINCIHIIPSCNTSPS